MTREEAIEWLEDEKDEYLAKLGTNAEAYDMAIEALKEKAEKLENMQMDSSVAEGGG